MGLMQKYGRWKQNRANAGVEFFERQSRAGERNALESSVRATYPSFKVSRDISKKSIKKLNSYISNGIITADQVGYVLQRREPLERVSKTGSRVRTADEINYYGADAKVGRRNSKIKLDRLLDKIDTMESQGKSKTEIKKEIEKDLKRKKLSSGMGFGIGSGEEGLPPELIKYLIYIFIAIVFISLLLSIF